MKGLRSFVPSRFWGASAFIYVYGFFVGVILLGWSLAMDRRLPVMPWWALVLAPLAIGLAALASEVLGEFLFNGFSPEPVESKARQLLGRAVLSVLVLLTAVYGWPIMQMSSP